MGGGGDDNLSVNNTTPAGTVIELYGEAGNDTLSGGNNINELLIGGGGNDTLNGGNGNDTLYGDDVPTQTFSPADPFTISQSGGTTYLNVASSGSLFNERRVARFNSASSVSVASATQDWKATLPIANSSSTALRYRQDVSLTPKDLSGIASVSFDITVAGSVTGYWNLMDMNGYIAEVPAGFALSAGNHTVTLDLSTAAIDPGFDLSAIVSMEIWILAASANSTISASNLRYGVIPATLVTTDADPFTAAQAGGPAWANISGSLFAQRQALRTSGGTASVGSGAWTVGSTTTYGFAALNYRQDANYVGSIDLSGIQSLSFNAAVSGAVVMDWTLMDENERWLWVDDVPLTGTSTQTLNFSTAAADPGFDLSSVAAMSIVLTDLQTGESVTVTNLKATSGAPETGGNDILNGGGGSDFLFGQAGDDTINWGNGPDDVATGGIGNDIFIQDNNFAYQTLFGTITDFTKGTDMIRIKAAVVGLNAGTATLVYGTAHLSNKIVVDTTSVPGTTTLRLPIGGTGQIFLRGMHPDLTINDFVLF
jgi:hypothetical protein